MRTKVRCPACGKMADQNIEIRKIPHFGEVMLTATLCPHCGYRHSDVMPLESRGEKKIVWPICEDTLGDLVVRSSYALVRIPEAGVELTPGPFSNGFITTVEGVVRRFLDRMGIFERSFPEKRELVEKTKRKLEALAEGKERGTLIIYDPHGLSAVVPKKNKTDTSMKDRGAMVSDTPKESDRRMDTKETDGARNEQRSCGKA